VAEEDFNYKQIIPYSFIYSDGCLFSYVRGDSGGEKRLKKKRSIGIGGHVNDSDIKGTGWSNQDAMLASMFRERGEEVAFGGEWQLHLVGAINDDGNDVGKVHFGVVHQYTVENRLVTSREDAIAEPEFVTVEGALEPTRLAEYEPWSRYVLEAIRDGEIRLDKPY
jgi:predicted NUDIX family phosphoesterase